jgi:hypothetical protein
MKPPIVEAFYNPGRRNWDECIERVLKERGLIRGEAIATGYLDMERA